MNPEAASLVSSSVHTRALRRFTTAVTLTGTALLLTACGAAAPQPSPTPAEPPIDVTEPSPAVLLRASYADTEGFAAMPEPQPGEWLARFDESIVPFEA